MTRSPYLILFFVLFVSTLISEKTSEEIQLEIDLKRDNAEKIASEIEKISKQINKKDIVTKETKKKIIQIEEQIRLAEELLGLIKSETQNISKAILDIEIEINYKKAGIIELKQKYSNMLAHLYKTENNGYLDILLNSDNWNDTIYKKMYLEIITEEKEIIESKLNEAILNLNNQITTFANQFSNNQGIFNEEKGNISQLKKKQSQEKNKKEKLILERKNLEQERVKNKQTLLKIDQLLQQLYVDKDAAKKREEEIRKKREEKLRKLKEEKERKERLEKQQFANNKGSLPWPVKGTIVEKYNKSKEMIGIRIKTKKNEEIKSVFDGIVVREGKELGSHRTTVEIDHKDGYYTIYYNIDVENINLVKDQYIEAGTLIGKTYDETLEFYVVKYDEKKYNQDPFSIYQNPEDWLK